MFFFKTNYFSTKEIKKKQIKHRLSELYERCYAAISRDEQANTGLKDSYGFLNINISRKKTKQYPIASAKEIEFEIIEILKKYEDEKIVFIFDELDKVDPDFDRGLFQVDSNPDNVRTYLNDLRDRRNLIIKTLSSLKHLFTEGKARFIFIAGREMFDAALADISDRQSSLSSVFHRIIYVESFLKESPDVSFQHKMGITYMIEKYLDSVLIPNNTKNMQWYVSDEPFLKNYHEYLSNEI